MEPDTRLGVTGQGGEKSDPPYCHVIAIVPISRYDARSPHIRSVIGEPIPIRRAAWTARRIARAVHANRPPDDRFHRQSPVEHAFASVAMLSRRRLIAADSDSSQAFWLRSLTIGGSSGQIGELGPNELAALCEVLRLVWSRWKPLASIGTSPLQAVYSAEARSRR